MPLTDDNWNAFLTELRSGQCCLLLGPEIKCIPDEQDKELHHSVTDLFAAFLKKKLDAANTKYNNEENDFFYLANRYINTNYPGQETKFESEINAFKEQLTTKDPPFFKKIARLPFNSVVNLVPDNFLSAQLTSIGYEFVDDYYDYTVSRDIDITNEMQLVYNLFGSFENSASIAVTEQQRLNLLKNLISGSPKIQDKITNRFSDKKKSFLFLGFNFNDWHFRLVMDALKISKPNNFSFSPLIGKEQSVGFLTREFYSEKLGLNLVDQTTEEFTDELANRYQAKFGDFDRKLKVVLDYLDADTTQVEEFKTALDVSGLSTRIELWHKGLLKGGDTIKETEEKVQEAEVYIAFLSNAFLKEPGYKERVTASLNEENKKVILVYTNFCPFEKILPVKKARIILPRNNVPLSSKTGTDLAQVCHEAVRIINSVVR
jgi:SIR2-like domain/TIR domain